MARQSEVGTMHSDPTPTCNVGQSMDARLEPDCCYSNNIFTAAKVLNSLWYAPQAVKVPDMLKALKLKPN